eukprot:scaffold165747_cov27-Tisochrysis_lutea.AAC.1
MRVSAAASRPLPPPLPPPLLPMPPPLLRDRRPPRPPTAVPWPPLNPPPLGGRGGIPMAPCMWFGCSSWLWRECWAPRGCMGCCGITLCQSAPGGNGGMPARPPSAGLGRLAPLRLSPAASCSSSLFPCCARHSFILAPLSPLAPLPPPPPPPSPHPTPSPSFLVWL